MYFYVLEEIHPEEKGTGCAREVEYHRVEAFYRKPLRVLFQINSNIKSNANATLEANFAQLAGPHKRKRQDSEKYKEGDLFQGDIKATNIEEYLPGVQGLEAKQATLL